MGALTSMVADFDGLATVLNFSSILFLIPIIKTIYKVWHQRKSLSGNIWKLESKNLTFPSLKTVLLNKLYTNCEYLVRSNLMLCLSWQTLVFLGNLVEMKCTAGAVSTPVPLLAEYVCYAFKKCGISRAIQEEGGWVSFQVGLWLAISPLGFWIHTTPTKIHSIIYH